MEAATTVEKAVELLFHLHGEDAPRGVTAIGRALGMPKSSAHRLLRSLALRGLVEQDELGRYRPGIGLVALGIGVLDREPLVVAARPVLEVMADGLGETFFLVAARAGQLRVLDKCEGSGFLRAAPRVGEKVPVHATAVGRLHLAFAPDLVQPPETPWKVFTPDTPRNLAGLNREVARTRRRGFALSRDEWVPGLSVAAAPVRSRGRMGGALAVAAASGRFETLGADALAAAVRDAARRVEARLEGRGQ